MLTMWRDVEDRIQVGDAVIEVIAVRRGSVRLGITAPESVPIRRLEVLPEPVTPDDREITDGR